MLTSENLKSVLLEALEKYLETYNNEHDSQVSVGIGEPEDDSDIVIDGGDEHGVFYISVLDDNLP